MAPPADRPSLADVAAWLRRAAELNGANDDRDLVAPAAGNDALLVTQIPPAEEPEPEPARSDLSTPEAPVTEQLPEPSRVEPAEPALEPVLGPVSPLEPAFDLPTAVLTSPARVPPIDTIVDEFLSLPPRPEAPRSLFNLNLDELTAQAQARAIESPSPPVLAPLTEFDFALPTAIAEPLSAVESDNDLHVGLRLKDWEPGAVHLGLESGLGVGKMDAFAIPQQQQRTNVSQYWSGRLTEPIGVVRRLRAMVGVVVLTVLLGIAAGAAIGVIVAIVALAIRSAITSA